MSLFSKLFGGGGSKAEAEPTRYNGYTIYPEPVKDGATFRVAARIEKDIDGATKTHQLIRADTLDDQDAAVEASIRKAKQVIDEQGDRIFG